MDVLKQARTLIICASKNKKSTDWRRIHKVMMKQHNNVITRGLSIRKAAIILGNRLNSENRLLQLYSLNLGIRDSEIREYLEVNPQIYATYKKVEKLPKEVDEKLLDMMLMKLTKE